MLDFQVSNQWPATPLTITGRTLLTVVDGGPVRYWLGLSPAPTSTSKGGIIQDQGSFTLEDGQVIWLRADKTAMANLYMGPIV